MNFVLYINQLTMQLPGLKSKKTRVLTFFSMLILTFGLSAQKTIDDQFHAWSVYQGNHHLSEKCDLHTEYQFRRANGFAVNWENSSSTALSARTTLGRGAIQATNSLQSAGIVALTEIIHRPKERVFYVYE